MGEKRTKNVLLLCLSLYRSDRHWFYVYDYNGRSKCRLDGFNSNEPHAKRILEKLKIDGEKLDQVVVLCSPEAQKSMDADFRWNDDKDKRKAFQQEMKAIHGDEDIDVLMGSVTHYQHYKEVVQKYALKTSRKDYEPVEDTLKFSSVPVMDFLDESDIAEAVTKSALEILDGDYDSINLYVDTNGGPRVVALLVMVVSNLLETRNVHVVEMDYIEAEERNPYIGKDNKKRLKIQNMDAISKSMNLVTGIREFINYGRIRTLSEYFQDCKNKSITSILQELEVLTNDMQLCLTGYIMTRREAVAEALENWQPSSQENISKEQKVYETMFSFVAEDILNGCHDLLYGDLPEMIRWCVDKGFMQQALYLYAREMPEYFWRTGIFTPSDPEWIEYKGWLEEKHRNGRQRGENIYEQWLNVYVPEIQPPAGKDAEIHMPVSPESLEVYQVVQDTDGFLHEALRTAEVLLDGVRQGRMRSNRKRNDLRQILVEYQLIRRQYEGTEDMPEFAENGDLLDPYDEMENVLHLSAARISGKAEKGGTA